MSRVENTPPAPAAAAPFDLATWLRKHGGEIFVLFVIALAGALLRTVWDVMKAYKGMESSALGTSGFFVLVIINFVFTVLLWYLANRVLPGKYALFPLSVKDMGLVLLAALFLPTFLNLDIKFAQVLPGATQFGAQESSVFSLHDLYSGIVEPTTRGIFADVDQELERKIAPVVEGYGCETGVPRLYVAVNKKLRTADFMTEDTRKLILDEIQLAYKDEEASFVDRADTIARQAVRAFGLDFVNETFDEQACQAAPE